MNLTGFSLITFPVFSASIFIFLIMQDHIFMQAENVESCKHKGRIYL